MRPLIFSCFILLLLGACAPSVQQPDKQVVDPEQQARDYLQQENYTAAAAEYLRLSEQDKTSRYQLRAANSYLLAGNTPQSERILSNIDASTLDEIGSAEFRILQARIDLMAEDPASAMQKLDWPLPDSAPSHLKKDYHQARAEAFEKTEHDIMALKERVQLNALLENTTAIDHNSRQIWRLISRFDQDKLNALQAANGSELQGWIDLARISRTQLFDATIRDVAMSAWNSQYPSHPARPHIIPELLTQAEQFNRQPETIALLLPFEGQYKYASSAIREGFLAAWYDSGVQQPVVKLYDTSTQDISSVYQQAVSDGADFIVGPLDKEAVAILHQQEEIAVPTLALNQLQNSTDTANEEPAAIASRLLFQFGLLPEQEAANAADRAWFDGHSRALIITPESEWGNRVTKAFIDRWQQQGGTVLGQARISPVRDDLSTPVKQLLNIDDSVRRNKELTAMLRRELHHEPRRRQDADVIFLAAEPVIARQLIPQLRFYRAGDLATYSISRIYPGVNEVQANSDINNVIFADMPWLLDPDHKRSALQQSLNNNWQQNISPYRRLYAFGVDAYRLIPQLAKLQMTSGVYAGETGQLRVNRDGTIRREQSWAKIIKGSPRLLDSNFKNE